METIPYKNLGEKGYTIVDNILTPRELDAILISLKKDVSDIYSYQTKFSSEQPKNINICFNEEQLKHITFNERIYETASEIVQSIQLVHAFGPSCISINDEEEKPCIDSNPFLKKIIIPNRVSSLISIQLDTSNLFESGTMCILPYFHLFWEFFARFFHPVEGYEKYPAKIFPFFYLNVSEKDDTFFDSYILPLLKQNILEYANYLRFGKNKNKTKQAFFWKMKKDKISFPENATEYIKNMNWEYLSLSPGSMVFWDPFLPYFISKNNTTMPRIFCRYSILPVDKNWYDTSSQHSDASKNNIYSRDWVLQQFRECKSYFDREESVPQNRFYSLKNREEWEYISFKKKERDIQKIIFSTPFTRMMIGELSYYDFVLDWTTAEKIRDKKYGLVWKVYDRIRREYIISKTVKIENIPTYSLEYPEYLIPVGTSQNHLIKFLGYGKETENTVEFFWKYYKQKTLSEYAKNYITSEEEAFSIFFEIVTAVYKLHKQNIVHMDIKEKNIFIDNHHAYLGDFGFCRKRNISERSKGYTGTLNHISPEMCHNKIESEKEKRFSIDSYKQDAWTLGVVYYYLLFKKNPHDYSHDDETGEICIKKKGKVEIPSSYISTFSEVILERLLDISQEERITVVSLYEDILSPPNVYFLREKWKQKYTFVQLERCLLIISKKYPHIPLFDILTFLLS